MTDQLPMTPIITAIAYGIRKLRGEFYHRQRAVKPSWFEPCSTPDCDISAWVTEDTEEPFCCMLCELEGKGKP